MKDLIVIGSGGHARSVIDAAMLNSQLNISGVLDINFEEERNEEILGVPLLGGIRYLEKICPEKTAIFLAVGDNRTRKRIALTVEDYGLETINIVHPQAYICDEALLGNGNFVGAFANVGPGVKIGDYCILNTSSNLEHEVSVGNFCHIGPGAMICGRSRISDNVFVGAGGVVIDKISIPAGVVIGAGAVVTKNLSDLNSTYIGLPARKV